MVNAVSPLAPANVMQVPRPSPASSEPRRLTADDFRGIISDAIRKQNRWDDGWDVHNGPAPSLDIIVEADVLKRNNFDPADAAHLIEVAKKEQARRDGIACQGRLQKFNKTIGARFAAASLDNYKTELPGQAKALAAVRSYAGSVKERASAGEGIVLFGAAGTGKTHLLAAVAKAAILAGLSVEWRNGQDLFGEFRAAIDGNGNEDSIIKALVKADVLVADDLLPPGGRLSDYQATMLYRITNARYEQCRPTLVSMNVADGEEAAAGMGAQVVDRLRDGALTLFCDWPTNRKAKA